MKSESRRGEDERVREIRRLSTPGQNEIIGQYEAGRMTRREFIRRGSLAGMSLPLLGFLAAACTPDDTVSTTEAAGATTTSATTPTTLGTTAAGPNRGGDFRVAGTGGGEGESVDAAVVRGRSETIRHSLHYDQLYEVGYDLSERNVLAEEFVRVEDAGDVWEVRLRDDVEFHHGKTLTADDVIFTFQRIFDPEVGANAVGRFRPFVDPADIVKRDDRTVRFNLLQPYQEFPALTSETHSVGIVPTDFDPTNPVGSGPFRLVSFAPGQESVSERFENYWGEPTLFDTVTYLTVNDSAARLNALLSGQVEAIRQISIAQVPELEDAGFEVLNTPGGRWIPFAMAVDEPPFDDVRVRQAMRLVAGRTQMIDQALGGAGTVGHDLYAPYDKCFADDLTREADVEQARFLLSEAGQEDLTVELVAAPLEVGLVEAAQVYSQQAIQAGITVNVRRVDIPTLFGPEYLQWPFSVSSWPGFSYLLAVAQSTGPTASFNETHFSDEEFNDLYFRAVSEPDPDIRCEILHAMQEIEFERGGYIVWGFVNNINAHASSVTGFVPQDIPAHFQIGADMKQAYFVDA